MYTRGGGIFCFFNEILEIYCFLEKKLVYNEKRILYTYYGEVL